MQPLDDPAAELFCGIARARRDDPALPALLARVDGVPLAITLLAHVAEGVSLADLVEEWTQKHTALLIKEGVEPGRQTSWAASMAVSVASPRMTGEGLRLLALLGRLPDGVAFADINILMSGNASDAKRRLVQVGLAYEEGERLRVLAPVRAYLRDNRVVQRKDLARAMAHYGGMARTLGSMAGREGGAEAVARLASETANLDAMVREGLHGSGASRWIETAIELTHFARFSGRYFAPTLDAARVAAREKGFVRLEGACVAALGEMALSRSDHDEARRRFGEAQPICHRSGNVVGEANCIMGLGDIARRCEDYDQAFRRYDEALSLYQGVGHMLGQANCTRCLGAIAQARSDYDEAARLFKIAALCYRKVGSGLGEANCTASLGMIEMERADYKEAHRQLKAALSLHRRFGTSLGEANCILSLGDIALARSDHQEALRQYEEALPIYRRVGDVLGEGHCMLNLGDIARDSSDAVTAKRCYTAALGLYALIPNPTLMSRANDRLAMLIGERSRE